MNDEDGIDLQVALPGGTAKGYREPRIAAGRALEIVANRAIGGRQDHPPWVKSQADIHAGWIELFVFLRLFSGQDVPGRINDQERCTCAFSLQSRGASRRDRTEELDEKVRFLIHQLEVGESQS